jgi:hypothetical protein
MLTAEKDASFFVGKSSNLANRTPDRANYSGDLSN